MFHNVLGLAYGFLLFFSLENLTRFLYNSKQQVARVASYQEANFVQLTNYFICMLVRTMRRFMSQL